MFKNHITFLKQNTLFIILGDLIDGKKESSVNDSIGNFELLLHIFLFNLRIKAMTQGSYVLFTMGNHDFNNIILKKGKDLSYFKYKHPTSITYFNQKDTPEDVTTIMYDIFYNFYSISPYILLILKNGKEDEFICTHAGFLSTSISDNGQELYKSNLTDLIKYQERINTIGITNTFDNNVDGVYKIQDGLNSRVYENIKCNDTHLIHEHANKTIVVGHCPTDLEESRIHKLEDKYFQPDYNNCSSFSNKKGCVVADCFINNNGKPQLIFVDCSMSHAMRKKQDAQQQQIIQQIRNIEFLLLEHIPEQDNKKNLLWMNHISRKEAGGVKQVLFNSNKTKQQMLNILIEKLQDEFILFFNNCEQNTVDVLKENNDIPEYIKNLKIKFTELNDMFGKLIFYKKATKPTIIDFKLHEFKLQLQRCILYIRLIIVYNRLTFIVDAGNINIDQFIKSGDWDIYTDEIKKIDKEYKELFCTVIEKDPIINIENIKITIKQILVIIIEIESKLDKIETDRRRVNFDGEALGSSGINIVPPYPMWQRHQVPHHRHPQISTHKKRMAGIEVKEFTQN